MQKFTYQIRCGIPLKISTVCLEVQEILLSEELHSELRKMGKIDQSNLDGPTLSKEILRVLGGVILGVEVVPYSYSWFNWLRKRVVARVRSAAPKSVELNTYFFGVNDDLDYANTIGHETVHVVDNHSPYYFGHGDNDPSGDELTASHLVGDLVSKLYRQRRDRRVLFAAREGEEALGETLYAIGVEDKKQIAELLIQTRKGVYDYGTEPGTSEKGANHLVD